MKMRSKKPQKDEDDARMYAIMLRIQHEVWPKPDEVAFSIRYEGEYHNNEYLFSRRICGGWGIDKRGREWMREYEEKMK